MPPRRYIRPSRPGGPAAPALSSPPPEAPSPPCSLPTLLLSCRVVICVQHVICNVTRHLHVTMFHVVIISCLLHHSLGLLSVCVLMSRHSLVRGPIANLLRSSGREYPQPTFIHTHQLFRIQYTCFLMRYYKYVLVDMYKSFSCRVAPRRRRENQGSSGAPLPSILELHNTINNYT